jgi:hypothetical protein
VTATLHDYHVTTLNGSTAPVLPAASVGDLLVIFFQATLAPITLPPDYGYVNGSGGPWVITKVIDGTEGSTLDTGAFNPATGGGGTRAVATTWTFDDCLVFPGAALLGENFTASPREISGTTSFGADVHVAVFGSGAGTLGGTPSITSIVDDGVIAFADGGDQSASFSYDYTFTVSGATELFVLFLTATPVEDSCNLVSGTNPSNVGDSVHFDATISAPGYLGTITGTVDFYVDSVFQSTVAVSGGVAGFDFAFGSPGSHTVEADYSGDGDCLDPTTCTVSQFVNTPSPPPTTTEPDGYWGILLE